ncbi:MAG: dTDP-4-dehydrorhamnose reductase [Candidatus Aureabacteria bacterium]|nr:dTDP-4-dehydrorhamnose reductase [Candidatus Auribacterota bacterium]
MKIIVIGSNGQLGTDLCDRLKHHELIPLTHDDVEIGDEHAVFSTLPSLHPDVIINTASFHNVPKCEDQPEQALKVNVLGPRNLAKVCHAMNIWLIHFSTDYVFDGLKKSPYLETDPPNPLNFYAVTKLAGEETVKIYCERHKIIRVSGLYGRIPCRAKGGNFVSTMLKLGREKKEIDVVNDEFLTPTNTHDIANQMESLLPLPDSGIFHISNSGYCSWHEFASAIFEFSGINVKVNPIPASAYPSTLKRPSWSVLENARIKKLGIYQMRHWKEALKDHLKQSPSLLEPK